MKKFYNNINELLKDNNCTVIEGLKAVEFLRKNELKVEFNLYATYDFIVLSDSGFRNETKIQHGMKSYLGSDSCIVIDADYQTIDTSYDNLIKLMKVKKEMKAKKIKRIINNVLTVEKKSIEYTSNKAIIKNCWCEKSIILKLIKLGCKVSSFIVSRNGEFETQYNKDNILVDKGLYCATDMRVPSREFVSYSYDSIGDMLYCDYMEVVL